MQNAAPIQPLLYKTLYEVTSYMISVQFSLENIWYMPKKALYMSKKGTRIASPSSLFSGICPRKIWVAKIAARKHRSITNMIRLDKPEKSPRTVSCEIR